MIVYHVTPKSNLKSIKRNGVLPSLAQGTFKASWYVSIDLIPWAINHVARRHKVRHEDLILCVCAITAKDRYRHGRSGVYAIPEKHRAISYREPSHQELIFAKQDRYRSRK